MGDAPPTISARKLCWPELGWDHGVCAAKPPPPARGRASAWEIVLVSGPGGITRSGAEMRKGTSDSVHIVVVVLLTLGGSSHSTVAKALSGKVSRQSSWAVPASDQSRVHPQFAFVLHSLAFTPGALSMELVAQDLSALRHLSDLSVVLHTWGK